MLSRQVLKLALSRTTIFSQNSFIKELEKEEQWDEFVVKNTKPVIIDFYADWCGPCKKLQPLLQKHIDASEEKFDIVKINIDNHGELANSLQVSSIPAVFLAHNGQPVDQFLGFNVVKLQEFVDKAKKLADEKK